ncbi:retention module-containing protein, partial [Psychrobium sp. 1_MG-2023]|uniref:retention module-containing protein n=1 Tax=Psychrobium sp. 1_MG-2023 TaxID=3062624 RepID=UPI002733B815
MKTIVSKQNAQVLKVTGDTKLYTANKEMPLQAGDQIIAGEIVFFADGGAVNVQYADGSFDVLDSKNAQEQGELSSENTVNLFAQLNETGSEESITDDIAAIQALIEAGGDISDLPATAAGSSQNDGGTSFVSIERSAQETIAQAGFDTNTFESDTALLDQQASRDEIILDQTIESSLEVDFTINNQNATSTINGTAEGVLPGSVINITVTDENDNTVTVDNVIVGSDGSYQVDNVDLNDLSDGQIRVDASVEDVNSVVVSALANQTLDTTAPFVGDGTNTITVGGAEDGFINQDEVDETDLGLVIEPGASIEELVITGPNGGTVTVPVDDIVIGEGGVVEIPDLDLSGLGEGELTITGKIKDPAGNVGELTEKVIKDTIAPNPDDGKNSLEIGGGEDGFINKDEIGDTDLGLVIEPGASIEELVITGPNGGTVTVPVDDIVIGEGGVVEIPGLDLSGLGEGELTITGKIKDPAGNVGELTEKVIKDTIAPNPDDGKNSLEIGGGEDGFINKDEVGDTDLGLVVEPGASIEELVITGPNGGTVTVPVDDIVIGEGGVVEIPGLDLSGLGEGELTITGKIKDPAGNVGELTEKVIKDTIAPNPDDGKNSLEIGGGEDGFINKDEVGDTDLGLVVEPGASIEELVITGPNGGTVTVPVDDIVIGEGGVVEIPGLDLSGLGEGELTITGKIKDPAGNEGELTEKVIKDTIAPNPDDGKNSLEIGGGEDGFINKDEIGDTDLGLVVEPGASIEELVITGPNGGTVTVPVDDIVIGEGGVVEIPDLDLSGLGEGELTITGKIKDPAGNVGELTEKVIKDTIAPNPDDGKNSLEIGGGEDGFINKDEIGDTDLGLVIEPGASIEELVITGPNGGTVTVPVDDIVIGEGGVVEIPGLDLSGLGEGELTITGKIKDPAGNVGELTEKVIKDTIAPNPDDGKNSLEIGGGEDGFINKDEIGDTDLGLVIEPGASIEELVITGPNGGTVTVPVDDIVIGEGGVVEIPGLDLSGLGEGELTITGKIKDPAGNVGELTEKVIKDTIAPNPDDGKNSLE